MRKQIDRLGCEPLKFVFSIQINELVIPKDTTLSEGSLLSVCFERGSKISSSKNKPFFHSSCTYERSSGVNISETKYRDNFAVRNKLIFPIGEKLEVVATLYKDTKTGIFKEKTSKLILRQLNQNKMFSVDSYLGLGLHNLKLDELAAEMGFEKVQSSPKQLSLMYMKESRLNVVITVSALKGKRVADDNQSIASFYSEMSTIGATFSMDAEFESEIPFEFNNTNNIAKLRTTADNDAPGSSSSSKANRLPSKSLSNEPVTDSDAGGMAQPPCYSNYASKKDSSTTTGSSSTSSSSSNITSAPPPQAPAVVSTTAKASTTSRSTSPLPSHEPSSAISSTAPANTPTKAAGGLLGFSSSFSQLVKSASAATPVVVVEAKKPAPETNIKEDVQNSILVRQEERIKANEETFKLYQNELENRALRIKRLEMQLSIQSDQIYSLKKELARLKCESTPPASPNNIIFNSSSASPQSSHSASTVPEDSSSSSSSSSSAELWKVKEALAIMASEHSKTAAELSAVNETIMHYKTLAEDAVRGKEEETMAAQQAASAAVMANMRRAELDAEMNDVINELIDYKMQCANMAMELETEKKKRFVTKARLQQYAERVAALEILNMNYKSQESEEDDNVENTDQHNMFLSGDEADSGSARVLSLSDAKQ